MNNSRITLEFKESCLKQDKAPFTPNDLINFYISCELNLWLQELNAEFTLKDCLFENVKITKNANKYSYSGYGIEFDSESLF